MNGSLEMLAGYSPLSLLIFLRHNIRSPVCFSLKQKVLILVKVNIFFLSQILCNFAFFSSLYFIMLYICIKFFSLTGSFLMVFCLTSRGHLYHLFIHPFTHPFVHPLTHPSIFPTILWIPFPHLPYRNGVRYTRR